ncbi:unnamed protein product [Dicrocoelium dendriticum]|nr:unnamed protein product [Dicrocoelium dendriticum]
MSFLERWQHRQEQLSGNVNPVTTQPATDNVPLSSLAKNKRVVIVGGGDTSVGCTATALRQGAKSITILDIRPAPPPSRNPHENPWPEYPRIWRVEYAHAEVTRCFGQDPRIFNIATKEFLDNGSGAVGGVRTIRVKLSKDPETGSRRMEEITGKFSPQPNPFTPAELVRTCARINRRHQFICHVTACHPLRALSSPLCLCVYPYLSHHLLRGLLSRPSDQVSCWTQRKIVQTDLNALRDLF